MKLHKLYAGALALAMTLGIGCSQNRAAAPSVKDSVEKSFEQAQLNDINIDENRETRVLTLKGEVNSNADRDRAQQIAQQSAQGWVIANEVAVRPEGDAGDKAADVAESNDEAIKARLDALWVQHGLDKQDLDVEVKNGVVRLKGDVASKTQRSEAEKAAADVEGVRQVVNELQVKGRK